MRQSGKVFVWILLVLVVAIGIGAWYLNTNLDSIVARLIEEKGSEATGTDVSVGGVSIGLREGRARIESLDIANPEGFSGEEAIAFGEFGIQLDPSAVTSDPIVINEVTVNGARILMEQTSGGNNLRKLQAALQGEAAPAEDAEAGKKVVIRRFTLGESSVRVRVPQLGEDREVTIPEIVLRDLGQATNGATAKAIAKQVLTPVIAKALQSAAAQGVRDKVQEKIQEKAGEAARGLLDRVTGSPPGDAAEQDDNRR